MLCKKRQTVFFNYISCFFFLFFVRFFLYPLLFTLYPLTRTFYPLFFTLYPVPCTLYPSTPVPQYLNTPVFQKEIYPCTLKRKVQKDTYPVPQYPVPQDPVPCILYPVLLWGILPLFSKEKKMIKKRNTSSNKG